MKFLKSLGSYCKENPKFVLSLTLFLLVRGVFVDYMSVPSGSMNPTILEGDYLLTNKVEYGLRIPFTKVHLTTGELPHRGDIVVFFSPEGSSTLVKRVAGLPGDTVELKEGLFFLNGKQVTSSGPSSEQEGSLLGSTLQRKPAFHRETLEGAKPYDVMEFPLIDAERSFPKATVPTGSYFMLGDNRDNSDDSRYIGFVPQENLIGKAVGVAVSINTENGFSVRWARIGYDLR